MLLINKANADTRIFVFVDVCVCVEGSCQLSPGGDPGNSVILWLKLTAALLNVWSSSVIGSSSFLPQACNLRSNLIIWHKK